RTPIERAQATISLAEEPGQGIRLNVEYDSYYNMICVGQLEEMGRSAQGYLIHFRVHPRSDKRCDPVVNHAYLVPTAIDEGNTSPHMLLEFYRDAEMISAGFIKPAGVDRYALPVEAGLAKSGFQALLDVKDSVRDWRRTNKEATFRANPEFAKIEPLYNTCMAYDERKLGGPLKASYCQCVSEKIGRGGRVTSLELASYTEDFNLLIAEFRGVETLERRKYHRIERQCLGCSDERFEFDTGCSGPDELLYVPFSYADMIALLENNAPKIETTAYYKMVFFREYLEGYSAFCGDSIGNPVGFSYTVTETKRPDAWGPESSNVIMSSQVAIDQRYAGRYQRYYDQITSGDVTMGSVNSALQQRAKASGNPEASFMRMVRDVESRMKTEVANRGAIRRHLEGRCTTESVRTVYNNLDGL
ncbi:MAG: hypothetical protein AAF756_22125, partial [Pseudomonadota bacterium]